MLHWDSVVECQVSVKYYSPFSWRDRSLPVYIVRLCCRSKWSIMLCLSYWGVIKCEYPFPPKADRLAMRVNDVYISLWGALSGSLHGEIVGLVHRWRFSLLLSFVTYVYLTKTKALLTHLHYNILPLLNTNNELDIHHRKISMFNRKWWGHH